MPRLPEVTCFTMIPNVILDKYLELLSEGELKILLVIYRQTVGFKKVIEIEDVSDRPMWKLKNTNNNTNPTYT